MLRNLSRKSLSYLTQLFNHLLRRGFFPNSWKRAKGIPIPKPNKPTSDPKSYRLISLSTVGKLFERVIASRLTSFVTQHHLLPHEQFGFRKKTLYSFATCSYFGSHYQRLQFTQTHRHGYARLGESLRHSMVLWTTL